MIIPRIIVLAVALVASPVLAQTPGDKAESDKANSPDASFVQQSLALGSLSLATSRLAEDRVTMPKLKQFAQFETLEQTTITHILSSPRDRSAAGPLQAPSEDQVESRLDDRGRQTLARLRGMAAGAEFTRNYFLLEADLHAQLLKLDEDYLKQGKNADLTNLVTLSDAIVREHAALLTEIKADVDEGKGAARAGR